MRLKRKEKILILGLGGVGFYLAKRLQHEEYAVTAIEPDPERYRYGDESLDVRLIRGEAMDIDCWREADAGTMACVICVTDNDAVNMMSAQIADKFGIPYKIVRVHSLQFGLPGSLLSVDDLRIDLLINPEEMVAQEISRLVKLRHGNEIIDIAEEKIQLLAARITHDSEFADQKLKDISLKYPNFAFRVVAVARGITTIIPDGEFEIMPHDQIVVMIDTEHLPEMLEIAGVPQGVRQRVLIVGGGRIGCRVAELLKKSVEIVLIERDADQARELAGLLPHVEVLHGDGSKADTLSLAGVQDTDTFITTTGSNDTNIMSSLLAKNMMLGGNNGNGTGSEKTMAVVSEEDYQVLAATIGLDIALNKKVMAASEIMKHIRRSELISAAHLHGFDAEVVELVAAPNSPITKKPLAKLDPSYQGKLLIGGVYRDGAWQVAVGGTHIAANERVIGVCLSMQLKELRKLFSV
ncbi:Trk system potassium transporter TrkA [Thermodesulfobacteriota bacterium]